MRPQRDPEPIYGTAGTDPSEYDEPDEPCDILVLPLFAGETPPAEAVPESSPALSVPDPRLQTRHRRLLAVLTAEPQTATALARLADFKLAKNRKANSYVYAALRELEAWDLARRVARGWRLP